MKLKKLVLNNFRQFHGTNQVVFAEGDKRNTTVVFGNNGAGKTALLNAFTWVLYEKFSSDFELPDLLINKRAIADLLEGDIAKCSVELHFEHEGKDFNLIRSCQAEKRNGSALPVESEVSLWDISSKGSPTLRSDGLGAREDIGRILPIDLHKYFFFNGERIEQVVRPDKRAEIADATKVLLSVEILSRARNHLVAARKELEKDWKDMGDSDTKVLLDKKQKLEEQQDRLVEAQDEIDSELALQADLKGQVNQRLKELSDITALITQRDSLQLQQRSARTRMQELDAELRKGISDRAYLVFLAEPVVEFKNIVDGLRRRGELPSPIKSQFVKDLLDRESCICGSSLMSGSDGYEKVSAWLQKSSLENVEETAIRMGAKLENIDQRVDDFWQELDDKQVLIQLTKDSLSKVESELSDIKEKLRTSPSEGIQGLQKRLDEIDDCVTTKNIEKGQNQQKLTSIEQQIKSLDDQIRKHEALEGKQSQARRRCDAANLAVSCLDELSTRLGKQFRLQLEQKLQKNFGKMVVYPYVPKLNENYELTLVESTSGRDLPVPQSTGQSQILCLAFIVSILDCVREWKAKHAFMGLDSTTFPMVMDSPFGSLDEVNGRQVAKSIPSLVNQLVILVTKTQWRQEVSSEINERVGRRYLLSYETPKQDIPTDDIEIEGRRYDLVKRSPDNFEYTRIIEI